jgi:MtN3 and saliva related transmembrane protein
MQKKSKTKPKQKRTLLSQLVLFVGIAEPITTIPQIYDIFSTHSAAGVSMLTWLGGAIASIVWVVYAYSEKDKPLLVSSLLWVIFEGLVVVGTILY